MRKGWASARGARRAQWYGRTCRRFRSFSAWEGKPGRPRVYSGESGLVFMAGMTRRGAWGARRVARWGVTRVFCDGANDLAEARTIATTKARIFRLVALPGVRSALAGARF